MLKKYTPYIADISYRGKNYHFRFRIEDRGLLGFKAYIVHAPSYGFRNCSEAATWRRHCIGNADKCYIYHDDLVFDLSEMKKKIMLWARATVMYIADGGRMSDHIKHLCIAERQPIRQKEQMIPRNPKKTDPHIAARVDLSAEAFRKILSALGTVRPEHGGALGMDESGVITHFFYDQTACRTGGTYTPDNKRITHQINAWSADGVRFCGMIHSHPGNMNCPSSPDLEYAKRILRAMPDTLKGIMHMPIVTVNLFQETASVNWYIMTEAHGLERAALYVNGKMVSGFVSTMHNEATEGSTDIQNCELANSLPAEPVFTLTAELLPSEVSA